MVDIDARVINEHPDFLAELRAATDAKAEVEARWLAAIRAAIAADIPRDDIAAAVGMTRDGVRKRLLRADARSASRAT